MRPSPNRIRELRLTRGWSVGRLSLACGVNQSTLTKIERSVPWPHKHNRDKLTKFFKVREVVLFHQHERRVCRWCGNPIGRNARPVIIKDGVIVKFYHRQCRKEDLRTRRSIEREISPISQK